MGNKNFTRKDLSIKIHKNIGFSKSLCLKIIDDFFENITHEIIKLNKTKISSFGTFSILNKSERVGRNPKTKIETKISARNVIKFKASEIMLKKINSNN